MGFNTQAYTRPHNVRACNEVRIECISVLNVLFFVGFFPLG